MTHLERTKRRSECDSTQALWRRGATLTVWLGAILLPNMANAGLVWQQDDNLQSWLVGTPGYSSDAGTRTATVSYTNQVATNTGANAGHFGMYLGWAWSYANANSDDPGTPLPWSNTDNAFTGGGVSLTVARPGHAAESLLLGDVVGDTWIGVGWNAYGTDPMIATQADWNVPFFDFGEMAGGASVLYDITLTFAFDTDAAFDTWDKTGGFYLAGQGVSVPEPGSIALVGLALLGLGASYRLRRDRASS